MKRLLLVLPVLAALLVPSVSQAATNEVKICGKSSAGWTIAAGNASPQFPKTKCSFARATYRKTRGKAGRFSVKVRGKRLNCRSKKSSGYREIRCRGGNRFVLLYKF